MLLLPRLLLHCVFRRSVSTTPCCLSGGHYNPSNSAPRHSFLHKGHVIPQPSSVNEDKGCVLCKNGLDNFGYKDVLLLRQFLTPEGCLINKRITGICSKMQRKIARCVYRSRKVGLIPKVQE